MKKLCDEIFGDIAENEIVANYDSKSDAVSNFVTVNKSGLDLYADLFGRPYESDEEMEEDVEIAKDAGNQVYIQKAIRRRAIGACYYRHNSANSKYKTLEDLGIKKFNLKRATFHAVAKCAGLEMYLAKMSNKSNILDLNLRDSFFVMLHQYPQSQYLRIVNEMTRRNIPLRGKCLADFCAESGIDRQNGTTRTPQMIGVNRDAQSTPFTVVFNEERRATNLAETGDHNRATGDKMSQEDFHFYCYDLGLELTKRLRTKE